MLFKNTRLFVRVYTMGLDPQTPLPKPGPPEGMRAYFGRSLAQLVSRPRQ